MCKKNLCDVCLFEKSDIDFICIPTKEKYCSVVLLSCSYIAKCKEESCIIKEDISKKDIEEA